MTDEHLVKMADQIALNMAAQGDAQADSTAAHIRKFWTPTMRQQFLEYSQVNSGDLSPVLRQVAKILAEGQ